MLSQDIDKLAEDAIDILRRRPQGAAILGANESAVLFLERLPPDVRRHFQAIHDSTPDQMILPLPVHGLAEFRGATYGLIVVTKDADKQETIEGALPYLTGNPRILVAGYAHYDFRDPLFQEELNRLEEPSLANGYPNTLPHLFQCLVNAHRLKLHGVVAEFGTFRGGTTMFLARVIRRLGASWKVITFDTFKGFPDRAHPYDMYDHPDLNQNKIEDVRRYLAPEDIEIVVGDITKTASRLKGEPVVLSFMDTDNYTPAMAALDHVQESTVVGGAIVFDHFTGCDRFRLTLGERIAARRLVDDARYFNLHGTGVFFRQR